MVSPQTIYQWEWGRTEPSLSFLISLADVFGISLDEFAGRTVPKQRIDSLKEKV
jgi:DNA-binding XRE family transcriptional regulator